jgi:hypothetical protein
VNHKEKYKLLHKYCNQTASKEESLELETLLLTDVDLRQDFRDIMNLDAGLKEVAEMELLNSNQTGNIIAIPRNIKLLAVAIILLLCFNLIFIFQKPKTLPDISENLHSNRQQSIALITKAVAVKSDTLFEVGQSVKAGQLKFSEGILQIEFFSGATIIVEGPANLTLIDSMNIFCKQGKIRARVAPQAQGFSIKTTDINIVDLGTEFALNVPEDGQSSVHVFEGEVELHSMTKSKLLTNLSADTAATWKNQLITPIQLSNDFISFESMQNLSREFNKKQLTKWHIYAEKMRRRQDVILFYSFENNKSWSRTLQNESLNKSPKLNGAIVGCHWSEGRWQGKGALDFKSTGDRIKLEIPGTYDDMTFSCWVRIESFDRWLSSLLLTDGYKSGSLHWQLSDSGEIILGARSNGNTFSPPLITPDDLGRWLHIVTVYNSKEKEVVHYLNGKAVVRGKIKKLQKITLGKADIGNWTSENIFENKIRSLNGRLDEFIIFSTPLNEAEIAQLYQQGKPE